MPDGFWITILTIFFLVFAVVINYNYGEHKNRMTNPNELLNPQLCKN